ncbi:MAG: acetyl-CoA carboxylase biotin carboxyl carrier protein [Pseudomonadota bacterium]
MTSRSHEADVEFIRELAKLLRKNDLSEIEVKREDGEDAGLTVRLARELTVAAAPPVLAQTYAAPAQVPQAVSTAPAAEQPSETPSASGDPADDPGVVPSPMVGTVYLQPEPGAPSFIKVGDIVDEGQTLLIIEAMKTMNQIPAPRSGQVTRILVEDGSPVEFGAPLIILD